MINPAELDKAIAILEAQIPNASTDTIAERLARAVKLVQSVQCHEDMIAHPQQITRRIEPPTTVMRQLLESGYDTWVANLLGWNRIDIYRQRQQLQISPKSRGGDGATRQYQWYKWAQEWTQILHELGLMNGA